MGRNKKKFVEKDSSTKFVLLHRSQQDAEYGNEGASDLVLYPMDGQRDNKFQNDSNVVSLKSTKDHVNSLGFANDGYDYEKHLASISDGAQFYSKSGVMTKVVLPSEAMASTEEERDRQLEAVTLSDKVMDKDMRDALFNPNNFDSWDLDDDFVDRAAGNIEEEVDDENEERAAAEFDYDAHIAKMLAASENTISGMKHYRDEDEDDDSDCEYDTEGSEDGEVLNIDQKIVELEFEKALQEYDSDECGSLEDPDVDETLQGQLSIDNEDVSKLMDEFMTLHERDRKFHSQTKTETLMTKNDQISKLLSQNPALEEGMEIADEEEEEEEFVDGEDSGDEDYMPDYLKSKETAEFDCESIVSTYSNIENHPSRISEKSNKKKKKKKLMSEDGEESVSKNYGAKVITISAKTGLPVVQEKRKSKEDEDDDELVVNKGEGRNKKETKEEKRLRKLKVKEERRENRSVKTKLKTAYKEDERLTLKTSNACNGVPMFKY